MKAAQDDDNEKRVDRLDVAKAGDRSSVSHSTIDPAPSPTRSTSAYRGLCKVDSASGFILDRIRLPALDPCSESDSASQSARSKTPGDCPRELMRSAITRSMLVRRVGTALAVSRSRSIEADLKELNMSSTTGSWAYGEKAPMPSQEQTTSKGVRGSLTRGGFGTLPPDAKVAAGAARVCEEIGRSTAA